MTDQWLADAVARNPIHVKEDGSIVTCPVRLAFVDVFRPADKKRQDNDDGNNKAKFGATLLFPPQATPQISAVFWPIWLQMCQQKFPRHFDPSGQPQGLHWPFHDGREKPQYAGYTPGCYFLSTNSEYKPAVVDPAVNPIVDEARVYPGVWAIVGLNSYTYENRKRGVGFGLQVVMIVADDTPLGGAGPDPKKVFEGVKIDAGFNPAAAFGTPQAPGRPPQMPGAVMPPPTGMPQPGNPFSTGAQNTAPLPPSFAPPPPAAPAYAPPPPALAYDPING